MKKTLNLKISATSASLISSGVKAVEEKQLNMEDGATTLFSTSLFLLTTVEKIYRFWHNGARVLLLFAKTESLLAT